MKLTSIKTLGELKVNNYVPKSIKEELKVPHTIHRGLPDHNGQ